MNNLKSETVNSLKPLTRIEFVLIAVIDFKVSQVKWKMKFNSKHYSTDITSILLILRVRGYSHSRRPPNVGGSGRNKPCGCSTGKTRVAVSIKFSGHLYCLRIQSQLLFWEVSIKNCFHGCPCNGFSHFWVSHLVGDSQTRAMQRFAQNFQDMFNTKGSRANQILGSIQYPVLTLRLSTDQTHAEICIKFSVCLYHKTI